ncbi:MAG: EAL domain-containing protein [Proteobacteria bacterium]|nr:EAL domain-containing protein [Pseudomonadota bacterium]MBU1648877.1 EAL domain-containing protein [Pseudomonadota bacterium]MBU1985883.1 EAL domain-containing protein [Pseudomonadota bacterium]
MTLYRQLLIFTLVLFLVLFTCTWIIKLQSTRSFLEAQLESHAQDTATSLGLSISPYIAENDIATIETMINVVFDRGYYRTIRLTDLSDTVLIERTLDVVISDVPTWFIHAIPLKTPGASTLITAGWTQKGSLYVESHPGYAYKTLWEAIYNMTKVFGITGIIVLVLGALGLRALLQPLRRVEQQAEDLCKKQYTFQNKLPRTRELRRVVVAMNSMTAKVKKMFDEQARVANRLRKNAYSDVLTGLGNRRYLQWQVAARMDKRDTSVKGAFLLVQVHNLLELNQEKGYQRGNQFLQKVANCIREATRGLKNSALSHISGGSFAAFLPDVTEEDARHVAAAIARGFASLASEDVGCPENVGHIGGVSYEQVTSLKQLLSEADRILRAAQNQGPNTWIVELLSSEPTITPRGEHEWKQLLDQVLNNKEITLFSQSVVMSSNLKQLMHKEVLARITLPTGQMLNAGIFIPLAERLRRISSIDRIVIEKAMLVDSGKLESNELAVNISPSSLKDVSFTTWLLSNLKQMPLRAPKIIFEFAEFNATQELGLLLDFAKEVKALGHFIGLDHFGQSFANFGYLKSLQPKYVKIDRAFIDELKEEDSDSHFFIGSLTSVAHSLDILVIAEGVEDEAQYQTLCDLNIDGIQGFYIDQPREM